LSFYALPAPNSADGLAKTARKGYSLTLPLVLTWVTPMAIIDSAIGFIEPTGRVVFQL